VFRSHFSISSIMHPIGSDHDLVSLLLRMILSENRSPLYANAALRVGIMRWPAPQPKRPVM
jgi:hypothetical protein